MIWRKRRVHTIWRARIDGGKTMKKLSFLIALAMLLALAPAHAEQSAYREAPTLAARAEAGELPPLQERLPENPAPPTEILPEYLDYESGDYGGSLRFVTSGVNWNADIFMGITENLLTMASANSGVITPNIVEEFSANGDNTVFTLKLRKGLKWSDGTEVTMEDFRFAIENVVFNAELTPTVAAWMRDGGSASGEPFRFEALSDDTFTITFGQSYGGFAVHISVAGWKGYTELLKPAHYLKKFHKDYAVECHGSLDAYYAFLQPFATILGYDDASAESVWTYVFSAIDATNWEATDHVDMLTTQTFPDCGLTGNFPALYAWILSDYANGVSTYTRNPYYFKVDAAGQQLPYFDGLVSTEVEDQNMVQLKVMSGDVDFLRESASIANISLYREAEQAAGITAYIGDRTSNPTSIFINQTYGLDTDGTVKDDDASRAWQEVVTDLRFRQALARAIDAPEILDAVYGGFGEVNPTYACDHDIDAAKALLDEMGMRDLDGDGYRETPAGLPLSWQIWNAGEATDIVPVCELLVEFWSEIGLNVDVYSTESSLLSTSEAANEIPMRVFWAQSTMLWYYLGWNEGMWGSLWSTWNNNGGFSGALDGVEGYLEPPEEVKDIYLKIDSLMTVSSDEAVNVILPEIDQWFGAHLYIIEPLTNVKMCIVLNSNIGNVPTGGHIPGWDLAMEQMFYRGGEQ